MSNSRSIRMWYVVPLFFGLYSLFLPLRVIRWLVNLPISILDRIRHQKRRRFERQLAAEGRNLYPLW